MAMHIYESVSAAVAAEGVTSVFGLMGDGNMKLVNRMTLHDGLRFISCRHEASAIAAADAYARIAGRTGVATTTQGPGLTNTITALVTAARAATPLVLLTAATRSGAVGAMQDLDQTRLIESLSIKSMTLDAAVPADTIHSAFEYAALNQAPCVVNLPLDTQELMLESDVSTAKPHRQQVASPPDLAEVMVAVDYLASSKRPMIIAGRGAMKSGAAAELSALADRIGAILATSLVANGMFAGHPRNVGVCGGLRTSDAEAFIESADCVVVFGASFNALTTHHGAMVKGAQKIIQVDSEVDALGRLHKVDLGIVGDARETARSIIEEWDGRHITASGFGAEGFPLHRDKTIPVTRVESTNVGADPVAVMARLNEILPADRTLVSDGGHSMGFSGILFDVVPGVGYVTPVDFGSIGLGLGAAIGAACARPDRRTILTIGDGALLMNLGDLDTAARHELPLVVVVLDDAAYGAELHHLAVDNEPLEQTMFSPVDFAGLAAAMGFDAVTIRRLEDLEQVPALLDATRRPLLIDCKIDRGVRARWFEEMWAGPVAPNPQG